MHERTPRLTLFVTLALAHSLCLLTACDINGDGPGSFISPGLDCPNWGKGQACEELDGNEWEVTISPAGSRTLRNCQDAAFNGRVVDVSGQPARYQFFGVADLGSLPLKCAVLAQGPDPADNILIWITSNLCTADILVWEKDDEAFIRCSGTFDLGSATILGTCSRVDFDRPNSTNVTCDLDAPFSFAAVML